MAGLVLICISMLLSSNFPSTNPQIFFLSSIQSAADPIDSDGDGLPDYWEDPFGGLDPNIDNDTDGLSNLAEFLYCAEMDPLNNDTDSDGMADGWEVTHGFNPLPFETDLGVDWGTEMNPKLNVFDDLSEGECSVSVNSYQYHQDCLNLTDPEGESNETRYKVNDYYSSQIQGVVEFDYLATNVIKRNGFYIMYYGSLDCINMNSVNESLYHYDGTNFHEIMNMSANIWYHFKIQFDCTTDWHLWINGVSMDGGTGYSYRGSPSFMNELLIIGDTLTNNYSVYYDKLSYSWVSSDTDKPIDDPDNDNLSNLEEFQYSDIMDPHNPDTDTDGMPDGWEVDNSLNPLDDDDNALDPDNDNLSNLEEFQYSPAMDPFDNDTDSDGMPDGWEVDNSLNPLDDDDNALDPDNDNLSNLEEFQYSPAMDPFDNDTDSDGMPDGWEMIYELNPLTDDAFEDFDGDGRENLFEFLNGTKPNQYDDFGIFRSIPGYNLPTLFGFSIICIVFISAHQRKRNYS